MSNIAALKTAPVERHEAMIAVLKELLALAEAGEINSFIGVVRKPNGDFTTVGPPGNDALRMIGALEVAKSDLIHGLEPPK